VCFCVQTVLRRALPFTLMPNRSLSIASQSRSALALLRRAFGIHWFSGSRLNKSSPASLLSQLYISCPFCSLPPFVSPLEWKIPPALNNFSPGIILRRSRAAATNMGPCRRTCSGRWYARRPERTNQGAFSVSEQRCETAALKHSYLYFYV